jgi:uncharacterized membrane protein YedE/YeeE
MGFLDSQLFPLLGGLIIGASASLLLLLNGRIAGISGIVWSSVTERGDRLWRILFIAGLILGALICHRIADVPVPPPSPAPGWMIVLAGLLVGFGTRLGSGCTSGHGVCGFGRLSLRSLFATLTFMAVGLCTVFIVRHVV